jgi:Na+-driven multidrug efflux pump
MPTSEVQRLTIFINACPTQWEVLTIFASVMGPAEVAAWGMLGFVWDTFERITAGFADAAEVRIGFRMGAGQPHHAKLAAYKAMYMAVVVSLFSTGVLFILAGHLPRWLTPDPTLQKMVRTFPISPLEWFSSTDRASHYVSFYRSLMFFHW